MLSLTPEVQWTCRPDDTDQPCILSWSASKQIILVELRLHFSFIVSMSVVLSLSQKDKKCSWKQTRMVKKYPGNIFICTNPGGRQSSSSRQLQYKKCTFYYTLPCTGTVHYRARYINRTKVQTTRIGAISCAAEMPIQSLFLTSHFTALPSSLTKSLQTSLQGKIQFLSKPINLVKVIFFIIYLKD